MSTTVQNGKDTNHSGATSHEVGSRRVSTETKASFKTTELIFYILAVIGVLVASLLVKHTGVHNDYFRADKAWFYIVLLTIGYMGSRGLAKSGARNFYDDSNDHNRS
jgi:hypothetical protein